MKILYRLLSAIPFILLFAIQTSGQQGIPDISENEIGDPSWGFKFERPEGWVDQQSEEGVLLGHNTVPGLILVLVHMSESLQQMQQEMMEGIQEEGMYIAINSEVRPSGENVLSADECPIRNYCCNSFIDGISRQVSFLI